MTKIGRIYKIICTKSNDVYVGSTFNELRVRFQQHKDGFKSWIGGKHSTITIYPFMQQYGIESFKMVLIKEYEVVDRKHLEAYEQLWISKTRCVNTQSAFYLKSLYHKQYRGANKDKLSEQKRQYYQEHKDEIAEKGEQYRKANKDHIKEYSDRYRETNKEKLKVYYSEKILCDCGASFSRAVKARHERSKKHQKFIASQ